MTLFRAVFVRAGRGSRCKGQWARGAELHSKAAHYRVPAHASLPSIPAGFRGEKGSLDVEQCRSGQASETSDLSQSVRDWLASRGSCSPGEPQGVGPADGMMGTASIPPARSKSPTSTPSSADFREQLAYRRVYIGSASLPDGLTFPKGLLRRATDIVCSTPEPDEMFAERIASVSIDVECEGKDSVRDYLASQLIPGVSVRPPGGCAKTGRQWSKCIHLPAEGQRVRRLSNPKLDGTFGYRQSAFAPKRLQAIQRFAVAGKNYMEPISQIFFPFFNIAFKPMGPLTTAENKVASAGAIVTEGILELMRRVGLDLDFDLDEPRCFSLVMDARIAEMYTHGLGKAGAEGQFSHLATQLRQYDLRSRDDILSLRCAVENIYSWARGTRLAEILSLLDAYERLATLM